MINRESKPCGLLSTQRLNPTLLGFRRIRLANQNNGIFIKDFEHGEPANLLIDQTK